MPALLDGAHVAVVDDVERDAETTSIVLTDAGLDPEIVELDEDPAALVEHLKGRFAGVVCDHRLQGKVSYFGAEVVAACMESGLPAVLITTYADPRDNALIQRYRHQIPELLMRGSEANALAIRDALDYAMEETRGNYRLTRKPHRTVVRVTGINRDSPATVDIAIPAWSTTQVATFPLSSLLQHGEGAAVGQRYLADVNIYADSYLDLYATNFEPIPKASFEDVIGMTPNA